MSRSSIVRDSKFRHVFGEASKQKYEDLRLSNKATESCGIRANGKFFAFPWESGGGGTLAVVPLTRYGRIPRDLPIIAGHSAPILDFEFNPFCDNMVATASEDLTIKIWQLPEEGLKAHMKEAAMTLEGHGKKVSFCTFHPSVGNVLASASFDLTCRVWDLAEQAEAFQLKTPEQVMHLKWNSDGSLLAATCKDKRMYIFDPRASKTVCSTKVHDGIKASKVEWMSGSSSGDMSTKLVTTGFSSQAERQIGVWDMRTFSSAGDVDAVDPLNMLILDQGTGALFPFFDHGTQMLFVAGKGDGNVRYFEAIAEDPYLHYISDYRSTVPQKGFVFLPKRCVDTTKHEVMMGLKLESTSVVPVSFRVPRKSEAFQEDLFPEAPSPFPAKSSDAWITGKEGVVPLMQSMKPGSSNEDMARRASMPAAAVVSVKDLKKQLSDAEARIQALEKENAALKAEVQTLKAAKA